MVVLLLCGVQFVAVLDTTIVAVALPDIGRDLGFGPASLQWVVTAYTLAFGGLLIPAGRAGDQLGRRRLFAAGLVVFTAASAGCGLAPAPAVLAGLRAVQGAGCALMTPAALALLTALPNGHRSLGAWTAAAAGGGASGWVLGGLLTQTLGWRAIFFVNVPLGLTALAAMPRLLGRAHDTSRPRGESQGAAHALEQGESRGAADSSARGRSPGAARWLDRGGSSDAAGSLDLRGSFVITAALAALVLGLSQVQTRGFGSVLVLVALAVAPILLALFARVERSAPDPLLPAAVLRNRPFVTANVVAAALTAATTPAMLLSILYQQRTLHHGALETGLSCMPFNLAVIAGSLLPTRRMGLGLVLVAGGALTFLSGALIPATAVMGLGLGMASVASTAAGTDALRDRPGLASGLLNSTAQIGTVLGVAVLLSAGDFRTGYAGAALVALLAATTQLPRLRRARRYAVPCEESVNRSECAR
jgi:MFS family permease